MGPSIEPVSQLDPPRPAAQFPKYWWTLVVWLGVVLALSAYPVLERLVRQWSTDDDMGHGFFVPLVAGYIAWQQRDRLAAIQWQPNWLGLAAAILAGCGMIIGNLAAEMFLSRIAILGSVVGSVVFLGGFQAARALAFPLFLLVFMIPLPGVVYYQITFPLQLLASQVAEASLRLLDIPVIRDGNILELASQRLSVVEACSGIRSLLSLTFLSLVYGYFFDGRAWMRYLLFFATLPIAIAANASRVTITGLLSEMKPEYAQGAYHSASGWVIFMVALFMLVSVHQVVGRVYDWTHGKR